MIKLSALTALLWTALFLGCHTAKKTASMQEDPLIIPRSGWNAAAPRPFRQHVPVRITIHHEGTRLEADADAAKKIKNIQTWGMGPDRNWVDIPYHFLIAPDGKIFEGRAVTTVGETATEYDPSGHLLITCLGNLEEQELGTAQKESLIRLIAWCCKKYHIAPDTIAAHRDYSTQTTCPGKNLYPLVKSGYIREEVKKRMGVKN